MAQHQHVVIPYDKLEGFTIVQPAPPPSTVKEAGDQPAGDQSWLLDAITGGGNLALGAAKGLGQTGEDAWNLAGRTLSRVTGQPFEPEATPFLEATTPAQRFGKASEQIGEYFLPTGVGQYKGATQAALKLGPKLPAQLAHLTTLLADQKLSGGARKAVQTALARLTPTRTAKAGALATRTAAEFGKAAAISGIHGEPEPEIEGTIAAAGVPAGTGGTAALSSPIVQNLLAILGAGAPAGLGTTGLASRMGTFGVIKRLLADVLASPTAQRLAGRGVAAASRVGAGVTEQARKAKREREGTP